MQYWKYVFALYIIAWQPCDLEKIQYGDKKEEDIVFSYDSLQFYVF